MENTVFPLPNSERLPIFTPKGPAQNEPITLTKNPRER